MDIQSFVSGMQAAWYQERAKSQMTLGKMIDRLESMPPNQMVTGLDSPRSYRGYYSDIAFEPTGGQMQAGELLSICKSVVGKTYQGYKGGDYKMYMNTPAWAAAYGCCGDRIMAIEDDGTITFEPEEE